MPLAERIDPFAPTSVERAGRRYRIEAAPVAAVTARGAVWTAWGDGRLRILGPGAEPETLPIHRGALLSMAVEPSGAVLTGGDDGGFRRFTPEGATELAVFPRKWVDHVAAGAGGVIACSAGRETHLWDGPRRETFLAPSTVGGLAFDRKGGRLAVAHYGGVTIWSREKRGWRPSALKWAGSHTAVSFSTDDRFLMTRMQENELHGWRLRDKADLRMAGYPGKVKGWAWVGKLPWLATTGADEAILWPFDRSGGPMGRNPLQVAWGGRGYVTAVAPVPGSEAVLAGYSSGAVVVSRLDAMAEPRIVARPTGAPVTLLSMTADGGWLFIADEAGGVLWAPIR